MRYDNPKLVWAVTTTPIIISEASTCILNGFLKSNSPKTRADATVVFSFSKAYWQSTHHSHL